MKRILQKYFVPRFGLGTMMMMVVVVAILVLWWKDHDQLTKELAKYTTKQSSSYWHYDEAAGPPNTVGAGDIPTAWASASQDNQREWLDLEYPRAVWPTAVEIHETYNPGAVDKITAFRADGTPVVVWKGADPTAVGSARGVSVIPIKTDFSCQKIRIHINSPAVPGWNEIDAVGLQTRWGTYWAQSVGGSSSYGSKYAPQTSSPIQIGGISSTQ